MVKHKVEEFYDELSENYKKTHSDRFVDRIFEKIILEYLPKEKFSLLDAGGGIGRFSIDLSNRCKSIVITEISRKMLNEAKKIAESKDVKNITFYNESVADMKSQPNESFDVVFLMNGVLDYCEDHKKALSETCRVLKKNGLVIGTVNNRLVYATTNILLEKKDPKRFLEMFKTGDYIKKFSIHDFTHDELIKVLEGSFKVINILGPTNLLRKWEYENVVNESNKDDLLKIQLEFSKKKEYVNNSTDFFFIAKKI